MSEWMKSWGVTIQMKATEQYFQVVLFIMPYKVALTYESGWNPNVWPFKGKLPAVFSVVLFTRLRYFYLHPILAMTSIPQE